MFDIKQVLNEKRTNKDGYEYFLFDSFSREEDLQCLADCLNRYCEVVVDLYPNLNKEKIENHIVTTLRRINSIRIDEKDAKIPPMRIIIDEFTRGGKVPFQDKKHDGVTFSSKHDGILMLIPDLKCEIEENERNNTNKTNGRHTIVHEFLHSSSVYEFVDNNGQKCYFQGIKFNNARGLFDDLNEGLNEYFTAKVMAKMYPETKIERRYPARVKLVSTIMSAIPESEQSKLFENYVTGNGLQILKYFSQYKNNDGENFIDFLNKNYQQTGKGISGGESEGDMQVVDEILKYSKSYHYNNDDESESFI